MLTLCAATASTLGFASSPAAWGAAAAPPGVTRAIEATVIVRSMSGEGSAVRLDIDGRVVLITAAHVVDGSDAVTVSDSAGVTRQADVLRRDPTVDLALLASGEGGVSLTPVALPTPGTDVYAVGAPLGARAVTRGVLSGERQVGLRRYATTDAAINPGNSGGPLVDSDGGVVGIVVATFRDADRVGLVVPSDQVRDWLRSTTGSAGAPAAQAITGTPETAPSAGTAAVVAAAVVVALAALGARTGHRRRAQPPCIVITPADLGLADGNQQKSSIGGTTWAR